MDVHVKIWANCLPKKFTRKNVYYYVNLIENLKKNMEWFSFYMVTI